MRPRDIKALIRIQPPLLGRTRRTLRDCHTVADARAAARRSLPRGVFDYVDGAAEDEVTMRANEEAFAAVRFRPRALRDVGQVNTSATILGEPSRLPLALAPTGFTRMVHPVGEVAVARAAAASGVPYTLSTMGTTSLETIAATPLEARWFQLYVWRDRGLTRELVQRAQDAGYRALFVTVDTPVPGMRERDARNGFTIPPALSPRVLLDIARRPRWWAGFVRAEPITFANVNPDGSQDPAGVMEYVGRQFDPCVTWSDLADLRSQWHGKLVIKGILHPADAARAVDIGADGIVVSNHGGRQLDRAEATLDVLPQIRDAVGDRVEVLLDSGVRRGADIAAALALGADACMIGRPYLYGLAAAGQAGVEHIITLLDQQFRRTLQLLGLTSVKELREQTGDVVRTSAGTRPTPPDVPTQRRPAERSRRPGGTRSRAEEPRDGASKRA